MAETLEPVKPKRSYKKRATAQLQPRMAFQAPCIIELTLVGAKEPEVIEAFSYQFLNGFLKIALPGAAPGIQYSRLVNIQRIADLLIQELMPIPEYRAPQQQQMAPPQQEAREFTPRGGWAPLRSRVIPGQGAISEVPNEAGVIEHVNAGFIE